MTEQYLGQTLTPSMIIKTFPVLDILNKPWRNFTEAQMRKNLSPTRPFVGVMFLIPL
jgi:hypothetical protein